VNLHIFTKAKEIGSTKRGIRSARKWAASLKRVKYAFQACMHMAFGRSDKYQPGRARTIEALKRALGMAHVLTGRSLLNFNDVFSMMHWHVQAQ
jgi:hypothetical protein